MKSQLTGVGLIVRSVADELVDGIGLKRVQRDPWATGDGSARGVACHGGAAGAFAASA